MRSWWSSPADRDGRRPSRRVMPPRPRSPIVSRRLAGSSWPGTSMSVATSSTSWRSTRVLHRRSSSSRFAGAQAVRSACPRRPLIIGSGRGSVLQPTACSIEGRFPMGSRCHDCRSASTSSWSSREEGSGIIDTPCEGPIPDEPPRGQASRCLGGSRQPTIDRVETSRLTPNGDFRSTPRPVASGIASSGPKTCLRVAAPPRLTDPRADPCYTPARSEA